MFLLLGGILDVNSVTLGGCVLLLIGLSLPRDDVNMLVCSFGICLALRKNQRTEVLKFRSLLDIITMSTMMKGKRLFKE